MIYNKEHALTTLALITDNLKDLTEWSINNNDKHLDKIDQIKELLDEMEWEIR